MLDLANIGRIGSVIEALPSLRSQPCIPPDSRPDGSVGLDLTTGRRSSSRNLMFDCLGLSDREFLRSTAEMLPKVRQI